MPEKTLSSMERGFSLVEILIALSIGAFGFLAAGQLLYTAAGLESIARSKETAVVAARNTLETLSALYRQNPSHEDLSPGEHGPRTVATGDPEGDTVLNRFYITWDCGPLSDPRKEYVHPATVVQVTARPVRNDNRPMDGPLSIGSVKLTAVLSPDMP